MPIKRIRKKTARTSKPARAAAPITRTLAMWQVDAFSRRPFHGNPAAVIVLDRSWLSDEHMQSIAAENNLAETAFVLRKGGGGKNLSIRWFTPKVEVDLCGHATLAAAHVLFNHLKWKGDRLAFASRSGKLGVEKLDSLLVLDFPALPFEKIRVTNQLCDALGRAPSEVYRGDKLMAVFDNRRDIYELAPDFVKLASLDTPGVIVTAPGSGHDFVSRFFAPRLGVNEDPVTGSAHCMLTPYWAMTLGKPLLSAHQVSSRGGELLCELVGSRVRIGGQAVTFMRAFIDIPA